MHSGVPRANAAGLILAVAVTALAGVQYAMGQPFTTLAWPAIAPLPGSLVLPRRAPDVPARLLGS